MTNIGLLSMLFIVYSKPLKFAKHYFFLRFELHESVPNVFDFRTRKCGT